MKHFLCLFLFLLQARGSLLTAQTLERPTYANAGNADARLTYTVGEAVVFTPRITTGRTLSVGAQPGDTNTSVKTNEANRLQGISVFPNPTTALLYVSCEEVLKSALWARLYDAEGRLVLNQNCPDQQSTLDLDALPAGAYLLHLELEGKTATFPILKTNF